jgi:hypothetical protein
MSTITTMDLMQRSIELDARFLVKKPLDSVTICSLWQHLDLGPRKTEMIQNFIQGLQFSRVLTAGFSFYRTFFLILQFFNTTALFTFSLYLMRFTVSKEVYPLLQ